MEDNITIILGFMIIAGLWWLYFVEYKQYRLDKTRQELFKIRDDLFCQWNESNRCFDEPAYTSIRETLNGMTRFAHRLSVVRFMAVIYAVRLTAGNSKEKQYEQYMQDALSRLPAQHRKYIKRAIHKMHRTILKHMVFSSLLLSSIFLFVFLIVKILQVQSSFFSYILGKPQVKGGLSMLDAEARSFSDNQFA
jgi:hypothetical protein